MPLDFQLNTTVVALQGRAVLAAPPADGQVLTWDEAGLAWTPEDTSIPDTVFNYNGTVPNPGGLPTSGQTVGDVYYVTSTGQYVIWNGLTWSPLGLGEAPTDGQTYGRNGQSTSWVSVLPLSGGTMTGPIILSGDASGPLNPVTLQQMDAAIAAATQEAAQFLGTLDAPLGQVFYTPQSGLTSGPLVPAADAPGAFVICVNAGTIPSGTPGHGIALLVGDWLVSDGTSWVPIHVAGTGSGTGGGITNIVAGTGLTGGGSTPTVTVALITPIPIASGGTGSSSGNGALDSLSGITGTQTGFLTRSTSGVWTLGTPSGGGGPTDATQVNLNPVIDGWTTVQQALSGIYSDLTNFAPIDSPAFTGNPTAPNPGVGDNSQSVATTSWVNQAIATYVTNWAAANGVLTDVTASGDVTAS